MIIRSLLALSLLWQLAAALLTSPEWITAFLTHDDTYLALQVARGWARHGFPTFDGIHRTNGFQPLWGLVLLGLARIESEPIVLLRAALVVAALCNTLTGALLARLCRQLRPDTPALAAVCVALWCAYCVTGKPALIALENALLPTLCAATLLTLVTIWTNPASLRHWTKLGMCLAALVWTRLDAIVLVAGCMCVAAAASLRTRYWAGPALGLAILIGAAAGYVAFERFCGGTNTPVSGLVKHTLVARLEPGLSLIGVTDAVRDAGNVVLKHAAIGIGLSRPRAASSVARIAILLLLAWAWALFRARSAGVRWVGIAAAVLFAHALTIRVWLSEYFHDTPWYYSSTNLLASIGVGLLLIECCAAASRRRIVGLALTVFTLRLAVSTWMLAWSPPPEAVGPVRLTAAAWLRENVPSGERVAAWNAGELAYFSGTTLINLDGLVNDAAFYRDIVRGQGSLDDYLKTQHVNWVADYAAGAAGESRLWDTLPADEWSVVACFGEHTASQQLVARRRTSPPNQQD